MPTPSEEYDPDSPRITREGLARAVPFRQRHPGMNLDEIIVIEQQENDPSDPGRVVAIRVNGKTRSTLELSDEVAQALEAAGPNRSRLAEDILRKGLKAYLVPQRAGEIG